MRELVPTANVIAVLLNPDNPNLQTRLRDVQEVLAAREFEVGQFYASHENWPATIARLQTVADSYPLFSHD